MQDLPTEERKATKATGGGFSLVEGYGEDGSEGENDQDQLDEDNNNSRPTKKSNNKTSKSNGKGTSLPADFFDSGGSSAPTIANDDSDAINDQPDIDNSDTTATTTTTHTTSKTATRTKNSAVVPYFDDAPLAEPRAIFQIKPGEEGILDSAAKITQSGGTAGTKIPRGFFDDKEVDNKMRNVETADLGYAIDNRI